MVHALDYRLVYTTELSPRSPLTPSLHTRHLAYGQVPTLRCLLQGLLCTEAFATRCLRQDAYSKVCFERGPLLQGTYSMVCFARGLLPRGVYSEATYSEVLTSRCLLRVTYSKVPTPRYLLQSAYSKVPTPRIPTPLMSSMICSVPTMCTDLRLNLCSGHFSYLGLQKGPKLGPKLHFQDYGYMGPPI